MKALQPAGAQGFRKSASGQTVRPASEGRRTAPILQPPLPNTTPCRCRWITTDRFADQRWLIYDRRRDCGYYYDGRTARRVTLEDDRGMIADNSPTSWLAEDERQFQAALEELFPALAIPPADQRASAAAHDARRYWKHLTESGVNGEVLAPDEESPQK